MRQRRWPVSFVAVSLNHEDILKIPALPALAARTLSILIAIVLFCLVGLAPAESTTGFAIEVLVIAVILDPEVSTPVPHETGP